MLMEREDAQAEVNARTAIHYLIRLLLSKDRSMITCHLANVLKAFIKKKENKWKCEKVATAEMSAPCQLNNNNNNKGMARILSKVD